jgi:hypothetical protein
MKTPIARRVAIYLFIALTSELSGAVEQVNWPSVCVDLSN